MVCVFFFEWCGEHRDLHVLTHSFPTRRSSDLDRYFGFATQQANAKALIAAQRPAAEKLVADGVFGATPCADKRSAVLAARSEEHTSELQSSMRTSYAVFCLKKKNKHITRIF